MSRSSSLLMRVFLAIVGASLVSVLSAGLIARALWTRAFEALVAGMPQPMAGRGLGRGMMLTNAQVTFLDSMNTGMLVAALAAVVIAAVVALLLARYIARPLTQLRGAASALAAGDLEHRVEVRGPAEVEDLGRAFNDMAVSLEEAEALRRRLVADVAHELRNPVAALRAQAEGIADGVLEADDARLASLVEDVEHLSRLITDLQELSAAEAGGLRYDMVPFDLCDLAAREAARAAANAAPGVVVSAEPGAAVTVVADELRISQVLRNILSNAVRHTPAGSVTVTCVVEGGGAVLRVTDTGEGIPEADLPYVFERFYRADSARARDTGGYGIGLAVARRIIEDHGGHVFAESASGAGATVGFTLPSAP
ncbi:MAG: HAMP domain-containing sensor histidine kinase [Coriobacteriia bacterium]|nr:HAMP domain-containing sensor histidine kinase [Coriobacteriia bacterium]